ncbi:hypothetical protein CUMW_047870 [Citrus unshiu]|nr:hypothetical protein CUMW_047870 [Citrus unshiu]
MTFDGICMWTSIHPTSFVNMQAPPVIVFSSACAGLTGGAVPAIAQLVSSSYHAAISSHSQPSPSSISSHSQPSPSSISSHSQPSPSSRG